MIENPQVGQRVWWFHDGIITEETVRYDTEFGVILGSGKTAFHRDLLDRPQAAAALREQAQALIEAAEKLEQETK